MSLNTIELSSGPAPQASIIILHGLGADGTDFIPMCDALDLSSVGPVRCVMPRAPERPVTINNGYRMRAWYDILGTELQRREDEAGLRESMRQVHALLRFLKAGAQRFGSPVVRTSWEKAHPFWERSAACLISLVLGF